MPVLVSALLAAGMIFYYFILHGRIHSSAKVAVAMLVLCGVTYFSFQMLFERYRNINQFGEHYFQ
jgi:Flp pilus assembly protein TadB